MCDAMYVHGCLPCRMLLHTMRQIDGYLSGVWNRLCVSTGEVRFDAWMGTDVDSCVHDSFTLRRFRTVGGALWRKHISRRLGPALRKRPAQHRKIDLLSYSMTGRECEQIV